VTISRANGDGPSEGVVVVGVADEVNRALTGRGGCSYESPPQALEHALALVEVLVGRRFQSLDGTEN
jgi:hypothetical protein